MILISPEELPDCPDGTEEDDSDQDMGLAGIRALWAAVLHRAISDWVQYQNKQDPKLRHLGVLAGQWLFRQGCSCIGSFNMVCWVLKVDPEEARSAIRNMTARDVAKLQGRWR